MSLLARLPSLNGLRCFEAAARHTSFLRAADELGVTPTAVSHQIRALEEDLGVALFLRHSRGVELTHAGRLMAGPLTEAFGSIVATVYATRTGAGSGELRIACSPSLASKWLVPRLGSFRAQHPEVDVRILSSSSLVDVAAGEADVALRHGDGPVAGCRVERLVEASVIPVCVPAQVEGWPLPWDLRGLSGKVLLHDASGDVGRLPGWKEWLAQHRIKDVDAGRGPRFSNSHLVIDAALAGEGIALAVAALVERDLGAGRLVAPLGGPIPAVSAYRLVLPASRPLIQRVQVFRRWLKREALITAKVVAALHLLPLGTVQRP